MNAITLSLDGEAVGQLADAVVARVAAALLAREPAERRWPEFMRIETAAAYLDVSVERLRKLKERRQIPFIQQAPAHRVLFARSDLDRWMMSLGDRGERGHVR